MCERAFLQRGSNNSMLPDAACSCQKPAVVRNCTCGVTMCTKKECGRRIGVQSASGLDGDGEDEDAADCEADFEELGCLDDMYGGDEVAKESNTPYDMTCLKWNKSTPCRGGLPFFTMHSNALSPALCMEFCIGKGLDIGGIVDGDECRCGASMLNTAAWHFEAPRPGLTLPEMPSQMPETECHIHVYRYIGTFEGGAIPLAVANGIMIKDLAYIDSIVLGKKIQEEVIEDGPDGSPGSGEGDVPPHGDVDPNAPISWTRTCWPDNCGPGWSLWPKRVQVAPLGVTDVWSEYVIIKYKFNDDIDDRRKEAVRQASQRWRDNTCIVFVEDSDPLAADPAHLVIGRVQKSSCYVSILGYKPKVESFMNMGWCNSIRYVGSVVHELGHVIGMNHEQKRPDAQEEYHGKGPYLQVKWKNVGSYKYQFQPDAHSYTGSGSDGEADPHKGYSDYDFGSIMHYPARNWFNTIP